MEAIQFQNLDIANRVNQTQLFGLNAVRGGFQRSGPAPKLVRISAGGQEAEFEASDCLARNGEDSFSVLAHLMTHLFPNGQLTIKMAIEFEDGHVFTFPEKYVLIANNSELSEAVSLDLKAHGTPAILPRVIDSAMFPYAEGRARAWFDDLDAGNVPLSLDEASSAEEAHRHLSQWGFCILPARLPEPIIEGFKKELWDAIESGRLAYELGSSNRIHDAHKLEWGRQIWLHGPVLEFLTEHFRDTPCACQTLTYVNGSEQNPHQDTIHLTPYPAGYMCGVWIALEDVQPGSGELVVYPGSHKAPRLRAEQLGLEKVDQDYSSYAKFDSEVRRLLAEGEYEAVRYLPTAGQILLWHENLVHGGAVRQDREKSRVSIVSHYFAKGAVAYYDSRGEAAALETLPELA